MLDRANTMPQQKRTREENVAKFGCNMAKEAQGLQFVRSLIGVEGSLQMRKAAEGARADFCVFEHGNEKYALGCQLKTTFCLNHVCGKDYFQFHKTDVYNGLLLVLIAFVHTQPRIWLVPGSNIRAKGLQIPFPPAKRRTSYNWAQHEIQPLELSETLKKAIHCNKLNLQPADQLALPTTRLQLQEHRMQLRLEQQLPLQFVAPEVEHLHHDFVVDGANWQMKVAGYMGLKTNDHFRVHLKTKYGMVGGKQTYGQYRPEHFDWLAILLPDHELLEDVPPHMYLIPMAILQQRGYIGREGVTGSTICLYPHRKSKTH